MTTMNSRMKRQIRWSDEANLRCRYLAALVFVAVMHFVPAIADTEVDYWSPWVTKTTTQSATINWRGEDDGLGLIAYATVRYYNEHKCFEKTIASMTMGADQHVELAHLQPDTSYVYRVWPSGNAGAFGNRTFQTMPNKGPFTFIVIGDSREGIHCSEEMRFKYVAEAIAKEPKVLFVIHSGDHARMDEEARWSNYFHAADAMFAKSAIFPVIGNHEYHDPKGGANPPTAADQYHWAYDMPLTYSFDCSNVRFVVLNSPDPANSGGGGDPQTSLALAQSQENWLKKQLDRFKLGAFTIQHHPIWSLGSTANNPDLQPWENLYHSRRISANFAGHVHNYQRFLVKGIPYFDVGTAGAPWSNLTGPTPLGYQFGDTMKLGYLKIFVDPKRNIATAQEMIVADVYESDSNEVPHVYDPPRIGDTVTFRLR